MDIPGLSTLYAILKRHIEIKNDVLSQRKELAQELVDNCEKWSDVLIKTFDSAVARWQVEGREAAIGEILQQDNDFRRLNYLSLAGDSPILEFLNKDERFQPFVASCVDFYQSALDIKKLVWGQIEEYPGRYVIAQDNDVSVMIKLWHRELDDSSGRRNPDRRH